MESTFYISREEAKKLLGKQKEKFVTVIKNGNMKVEYYVPKKVDKQNATWPGCAIHRCFG
jgi:hypothetical protein